MRAKVLVCYTFSNRKLQILVRKQVQNNHGFLNLTLELDFLFF